MEVVAKIDARRRAKLDAQTTPPATALDDAHAALARGDWEGARSRFDRAIRKAPSAPLKRGKGSRSPRPTSMKATFRSPPARRRSAATGKKATRAGPTNQWHHAGPHIMVLYPDAKLLDGLPTKRARTGRT
jgi:hypothetical protein